MQEAIPRANAITLIREVLFDFVIDRREDRIRFFNMTYLFVQEIGKFSKCCIKLPFFINGASSKFKELMSLTIIINVRTVNFPLSGHTECKL